MTFPLRILAIRNHRGEWQCLPCSDHTSRTYMFVGQVPLVPACATCCTPFPTPEPHRVTT